MTWNAGVDRTTGSLISATNWNAYLGITGSIMETATAKVTTVGDTVYATAANTLTRRAIGSAGQVLTVAGGVPTWATPVTTFGVVDAAGDLIYGTANDAVARLAIGSAGQALQVVAGLPAWVTPSSGMPVTTNGDLIYGTGGAGIATRLAIGATNAVLQVVAGIPAWVAAPTITGQLTLDGAVMVRGNASPSALTTNVNTLMGVQFGTNGGANNNSAGLAFYRSSTELAGFRFYAAGSVSAAGHANVNTDFVLALAGGVGASWIWDQAGVLYAGGVTNHGAVVNFAADVNHAGHILVTHNTYDIGAATTNQPRVVYAASGIAVAANPSTVGAFRAANNQGYWSRNAANGANIQCLQLDGADDLWIGTATGGPAHVVHGATTYHSWWVGNAEKVRIGNGIILGPAVTGGDKGNGTINVSADIYKANSAYGNPDYALEHAFTGRIERFKDNAGAARYPGLLPLDEVETFAREHLRLPHVARWADPDGAVGVFARADVVLELIEELHLRLFEINRQIKALGAVGV